MVFLINSIIKINAFDGKYVVLAGSGSGKTNVLVERTANFTRKKCGIPQKITLDD